MYRVWRDGLRCRVPMWEGGDAYPQFFPPILYKGKEGERGHATQTHRVG